MIYDDRPCELGEGPLWHPTRNQLFWFDILGKKLLTQIGDTLHSWSFDKHVSAAGWVDQTHLLIASDCALHLWDIDAGQIVKDLCPLEADDPSTRSNDGRADPWGGFWIGTMGLNKEPGAGAIYRFYKGELTSLFGSVTIPNAICFAPDRSAAYFTDTVTGHILRQPLDADGWPSGAPKVLIDLHAEPFGPDGAVTDADGNIWNAQWGAARVACYSARGNFIGAIPFEAAHTSCPAFGGDDMETLFCTSARAELDLGQIASTPENGMTFAAAGITKGLPEYQVTL